MTLRSFVAPAIVGLVAVSAFAAVPARVAPAWLAEGVMYRYQAKDGAKADSLPALRDLGVTVVVTGPSELKGEALSSY